MPAVQGSAGLVGAARSLWESSVAIGRASALEEGVGGGGGGEGEVAPSGAAGPAVSTVLVAAVHAWAAGKSFAEAWQLCAGELFEGELVRSLRQLDELLRQLVKAAQVLGDAWLVGRFEACSVAIHRGVPFAGSLYA